jgi:hypothetical protein
LRFVFSMMSPSVADDEVNLMQPAAGVCATSLNAL